MNTVTQNRIAITGNTYPVKEQLKALGARWNNDAKAWMVSPDMADRARAIVAGAGALGGRVYRVTRQSGGRGAWNGCSCGARELPGGGLSDNACDRCRFDGYDN